MPPTDIEEAIARGHPAANRYPMLSDAEIWNMADDIEKRGLFVPIEVHEGLILDGRNRWVACLRAGAIPRTVTWQSHGETPEEYVKSKNEERRHLSPAQRAALAAEVLPVFEAEAQERRHRDQERIPDPELGQARDKAAAALDVNPHYVSDAKRLREQAPEVFARVKAGELTIPEARRFTFSPPPEESPEEKGYYGLSRQRLLARLDPGVVAEVCADPALSLESFEELSAWLARFVEALRARVERPIRVVQ